AWSRMPQRTPTPRFSANWQRSAVLRGERAGPPRAAAKVAVATSKAAEELMPLPGGTSPAMGAAKAGVGGPSESAANWERTARGYLAQMGSSEGGPASVERSASKTTDAS